MSTILDLISSHGCELKRVSTHQGGEYQGPCPGCGGTDRFHAWPEQNNGDGTYWCRQCGKGGDCIQFLRDFDGLSFQEACERLVKDLPRRPSPDRPMNTPATTWQPADPRDPEELWSEKALKFAHWSYDKLMENDEIQTWLITRGIQTTAAFGLGWNSGEAGKDLYRDRESWGLSKVFNEKGRPRGLWLPRGLVIPYFVDGKIKRLRIRRPDPVEFGPRYYVVPGSSMATMVLNPARRAFVVVESELDAMLIVQQAGDLAGAVAVGSSSAKPDSTATAILQGSLEILVALDNDQAGANAWPWWKKTFTNCRRWPPPSGKDPGESYQAGDNLRAWILAGLPPALTI